MIVTLAGHVDHGKTALVRALTGVDTDRLEEEKARGLTIDLGFAYATIGPCRIGFVDVPGHQRFIHNMIAGVGANQHALLVVAADDGVMPQTIEHLQILSLMGLRTGSVAINKTDRVDADRLREVRDEVRALTSNTFLREEIPFPVSATAGQGLEPLCRHLAAQARKHRVRTREAAFRMAIDRAFSLPGAGTVVTGTVVEGQVSAPSQILLTGTGSLVRVRSINVQDQRVATASAGDRAGLNLARISVSEVRRGHWLMDPATACEVNSATLEFAMLPDCPRPIDRWQPAHLYHLTSHSQARIAPLGKNRIVPGATGFLDALLGAKLQLKIGDSVIVRSPDQSRTIGGGRVVNIRVLPKRRNSPVRRAALQKMAAAARDLQPAHGLAAECARVPTGLEAFQRAWNILPGALASVVQQADVLQCRGKALNRASCEQAEQDLTSALRRFHQQQPDSEGRSAQELLSDFDGLRETAEFALLRALENGVIRRSGGIYALAGFKASTISYDLEILTEVRCYVERPHPFSIGDIAKTLGLSIPELSRRLNPMIRAGVLIKIAPHRVLTPEREAALREIARELGSNGTFSVADFRSASGLGRNIVIDFLEYLDGLGVTKRFSNSRTLTDSS